MKGKIERIENILKENHIQMTRQRKEIAMVFLQNKGHFKPEEVYDLVKDKKIGLATVYRTIEIFKNKGIIKEISIGKDRYYELQIFSEKCMHIHFKCEHCNTIYDYSHLEIRMELIKLINFIEKDFGESIEDMELILKGICKECRRREDAETNKIEKN